MTPMSLTRPLTVGLVLLAVRPAAAQTFSDSSFALAVRLVTEGQGDSARALVRTRLAAIARGDSLYAEGLFAAGLVAAQMDSALAAFRRLSIEYSQSPWADDALLRMAQLSFAARDLATARRSADRVLADYPFSDVRAAAAYWAARVRLEEAQLAEACPLLDQAVQEAGDDVELANRARFYRQRCTGAARTDTAAPVRAPRLTFAVQVTAVGSAAATDDIMRRLAAAGYASRVVFDDGLYKVRVGQYASREQAQQAQADLRRQFGGSPFVVEERR
ncbi:MAG: tetratricopeptide repeat protein [Gemmatimonadota bacterium]|nr:tetratricopeptide repeat protein [Gemmatimonadota bacterium]